MKIKTQQNAKYFILCLEKGHVEHSAIVQWADELISNGASDENLIEISLSKDKRDIKLLLENISDQIDFQGIFESFFYNYLSNIDKIPYRELNSIFRGFWHHYLVSEELQSLFYQFDHYIDDGCLENGYVTETEVQDLMKEIKEYCKKGALLHLLHKY